MVRASNHLLATLSNPIHLDDVAVDFPDMTIIIAHPSWPWQDEALAQFSAMLYAEDRYGAARAKREGDMNARMGYEMMRLMNQPDGPVDAPAGHQSQIAYGGLRQAAGCGVVLVPGCIVHLLDADQLVGLAQIDNVGYIGSAVLREGS